MRFAVAPSIAVDPPYGSLLAHFPLDETGFCAR
jgi:hypothetical protein